MTIDIIATQIFKPKVCINSKPQTTSCIDLGIANEYFTNLPKYENLGILFQNKSVGNCYLKSFPCAFNYFLIERWFYC